MVNWPVNLIHDKYSKWYSMLINYALNRILEKDTYKELHHIIPSSLGGSNNKSNMVYLTAREHYIAHALLWKMKFNPKEHNKMTMALHVMVNGSGHDKQDRSYLVNSKIFEANRIEWAKDLSERMKGEQNHFYGKKHSKESKEKMSKNNAMHRPEVKAKVTGKNNPMYGKTHSDEIKSIISQTLKDRWTEEMKSAKAEEMREKWTNPEFRDKQLKLRFDSEGWKNRDWSTINKKAAATRKANGFKMSDEQKKKISKKRREKLASGEIIPWNKGTAKPKVVLTEEERAERKVAGIEKMKATKAAKKAAGWKRKSTKPSQESIDKMKATKAAKKAAGWKRKSYLLKHTPETIEKIKATKLAKKLAKQLEENIL